MADKFKIAGKVFSHHLTKAVILDYIQRLLHESGQTPHSASPGSDHLSLIPFWAGRGWAWGADMELPPSPILG